MGEDFLCCADTRLHGSMLTGRQSGGAVWALDLTQVTAASYIEWRGRRQVRYVLWLKGPEGWRQVAIRVARLRMSVSRELAEHRALSARVAEVLAARNPGFRFTYEVRWTGPVLYLPLALASVAAGLAAVILWAISGQVIFPAVTGTALICGGALAALIWRRAARRRWPEVSAAALPGILTAVAQRS